MRFNKFDDFNIGLFPTEKCLVILLSKWNIICNSENLKDRLENSSREIIVNDFGVDNDSLMTLSHFEVFKTLRVQFCDPFTDSVPK